MKVYLIFPFIFCNLFVFSQENPTNFYEVKYKKYFHIDYDNFDEHHRMTDPTVKQRNLAVFTDINEFNLFSSSTVSEFHNIGKINNSQSTSDHIQSNGNQVVFSNNSGLLLFKNSEEKFSLKPAERKSFVQDSLHEFDWDTNHDETREILGFQTKKATTEGLEPKTQVIAWYTDEIKMSHGPHYFWGLPGLILGIDIIVNDNVGLANFINSIHYEATDIQVLKDYKFINYKSSDIISPEEHRKNQEERRRKLHEFNTSSGVDTMD